MIGESNFTISIVSAVKIYNQESSDSVFSNRLLEHLEMGEGVLALKPTNHLGDISHCDIIRCPIEKRIGITGNLTLQDGQNYISDIFVTSGSSFHCGEKILIRFPVANNTLPPSSTIKVKIKCGHKWLDVGAEIQVNIFHLTVYPVVKNSKTLSPLWFEFNLRMNHSVKMFVGYRKSLVCSWNSRRYQ